MKKTKRRCNIIAPSVILPFDGLNSAIPAGFTRETLLDNKYIKGTAGGVNPSSTGGSTTHSHTSPAHSHTLNDHTHTGTSGARSGGNSIESMSGVNATKYDHTHTYTTGSISGGTTNGTAVTYGSVSNDPLYYTVIFIKSSGYNFIPNNAMVFSASTSRSGLSFHTASVNRFFKGADAGANAGGTGGSTQNIHSISHSHSTNSHTHIGGNTDISTQIAKDNAQVGDNAQIFHIHSFTVNAGTQEIATYSGNLTTTETVQPAYRTLNAFKNTSGASQMPAKGDIALWLGSLSSIPVGWKLCDGSDGTPDMRDRYYKNPASASASTTGGSNTHSHGAQSHSHSTSGSHTHSVSFGNNFNNQNRFRDGGTPEIVIRPTPLHTHLSANANSVTASYASANTSADSSSNEPEYRTVAFIQFEFPPVIPNPILMMMVDSPENV